jgi:hypothetical protein
MPLEDYSMITVLAILDSFGLSNNPYQISTDPTQQRLPFDIYYRAISALSEINLPLDTFEYFKEIKKLRKTKSNLKPNNERRVAFLFEVTGTQKYALLVKYQELKINEALSFINTLTNSSTIIPARICDFYKRITIQMIIPDGTENGSALFAGLLHDQIQQEIVIEEPIYHEPTGIQYTYLTLSLLCSTPLQEISLEKLYDNHRDKLTQQLIIWLNGLKEKRFEDYTILIKKLTILIKYGKLRSKEASLNHLFGQATKSEILEKNKEFQKDIFQYSFKKNEKLLVNLPLSGLGLIWLLHQDLPKLQQQIETQYQNDLNTIQKWPQDVPGFVPPVLSLPAKIQNHLLSIAYYFYMRSDIFLGKTLLSWFTEEIFPKNPQNTNIHLSAAIIGAILGALYLYFFTFTLCDLLIRFSVLFLVEKTHQRLKKETINLPEAEVISNESRIPSADNLAFLYITLLHTGLSYYTNQIFYLQQCLFILSFAAGCRYVCLKKADQQDMFEDKPQDRYIFKFLITSAAASLASFLFSSYANITSKLAAREETVEALITTIKRNDPTVNYFNTEHESLLTRPWRWFNGYNPFRFRFGNNVETYQADCHVTSELTGHISDTTCEVTELPKMLGQG